LAGIAVMAAVWLCCGGRPRTPRTLEAVDAGLMMAACGISGALALFPYSQDESHSALSRALLAITLTLVSRAVIVPSTARRTLAIGLVSVAAPAAIIAFSFARVATSLV